MPCPTAVPRPPVKRQRKIARLRVMCEVRTLIQIAVEPWYVWHWRGWAWRRRWTWRRPRPGSFRVAARSHHASPKLLTRLGTLGIEKAVVFRNFSRQKVFAGIRREIEP
jgi:hypothetical protein